MKQPWRNGWIYNVSHDYKHNKVKYIKPMSKFHNTLISKTEQHVFLLSRILYHLLSAKKTISIDKNWWQLEIHYIIFKARYLWKKISLQPTWLYFLSVLSSKDLNSFYSIMQVTSDSELNNGAISMISREIYRYAYSWVPVQNHHYNEFEVFSIIIFLPFDQFAETTLQYFS